MTSSDQTATRRRRRLAMAVGATVFLTFAGTAGASAAWTSAATLGKVSASAGSVSITQSGFESLAIDYEASRTITQLVTVTNPTQLTVAYTATLRGAPVNGLATGTVVRIWPSTAAACTANANPPNGTASYNWTNSPTITGTMAPAASALYCLRTSITANQQTSLAGTSITGTLTLSSSVGTWMASTTATAVQSVSDTDAPSTPGRPVASRTTGTQTTLTWAASTDNVDVVAYDVYRNGTLVGSSEATSFVVTGLTPSTAYSFTIKARDAADNTSAASTARSVTTSAQWWKITAAAGYCVDADRYYSSEASNTTRIITFGCKTATVDDADSDNQRWQMPAQGSAGGVNYFALVSSSAPTFMWQATQQVPTVTLNDGAATGTARQWSQVAVAGSTTSFLIKNRVSGLCVSATATPAENVQLRIEACNANSASQRFTFTAVDY